MRTLIQRFVSGESGLTAYGLFAAALMLIGVGTWITATASPPLVVAPAQINPLEMMANAKDLPTSPTVGSPAAPAPKFQAGTQSQDGIKHHRKMYMSATSIHKHKQLKRARQLSIAVPDLTQRSGAGLN